MSADDLLKKVEIDKFVSCWREAALTTRELGKDIRPEEDFRIRFIECLNRHVFRPLNVDATKVGQYERRVDHGYADAVFGHVVIEFKPPKSTDPELFGGLRQAEDYVERMARSAEERGRYLVAVISDRLLLARFDVSQGRWVPYNKGSRPYNIEWSYGNPDLRDAVNELVRALVAEVVGGQGAQPASPPPIAASAKQAPQPSGASTSASSANAGQAAGGQSQAHRLPEGFPPSRATIPQIVSKLREYSRYPIWYFAYDYDPEDPTHEARLDYGRVSSLIYVLEKKGNLQLDLEDLVKKVRETFTKLSEELDEKALDEACYNWLLAELSLVKLAICVAGFKAPFCGNDLLGSLESSSNVEGAFNEVVCADISPVRDALPLETTMTLDELLGSIKKFKESIARLQTSGHQNKAGLLVGLFRELSCEFGKAAQYMAGLCKADKMKELSKGGFTLTPWSPPADPTCVRLTQEARTRDVYRRSCQSFVTM